MRILLIIFLIICTPVFADTKNGYNSNDWLKCDTGVFKNAESISDTNTMLTFSKDTKALFIKNTGDTNEMYVDPRDGVAVASNDNGGILIEAGENIELSQFQTHKVGLIASSGESTTAQVIACW